MLTLAEITYPIIDPIALEIGDLKIRWYGIGYMLSFLFAFLVLRWLAKRGRWPVSVERVADVLFWGIIGVVVGGRLGYVFFYMIPFGEFEWLKVLKIWEGGMSFHGGLIGVSIAYILYARRNKVPMGDLCDGLALATPLGLGAVRLANFINAELVGTVTNVPWAMRFPAYNGRPDLWDGKKYLTDLRHPSQLYEFLGEGLLLFFVLRFLMIRLKWGAGRISGAFLIGYGLVRFLVEYVREPDQKLGDHFFLGLFTQGQKLSLGMVLAGILVLWICKKKNTKPNLYDPETGKIVRPLHEVFE